MAKREELIGMVCDGLSTHGMAKRLGTSEASIHRRFTHAGLKQRDIKALIRKGHSKAEIVRLLTPQKAIAEAREWHEWGIAAADAMIDAGNYLKKMLEEMHG